MEQELRDGIRKLCEIAGGTETVPGAVDDRIGYLPILRGTVGQSTGRRCCRR